MRILPLAIIVFLIASCECSRDTKNTVADQETHKILTNVQVLSVAAYSGSQQEDKYVYTDSSGNFKTGFTVSGKGKCPVLKLTLTKDNYNTLRVVDPQMGDTLFMKRIN